MAERNRPFRIEVHDVLSGVREPPSAIKKLNAGDRRVDTVVLFEMARTICASPSGSIGRATDERSLRNPPEALCGEICIPGGGDTTVVGMLCPALRAIGLKMPYRGKAHLRYA